MRTHAGINMEYVSLECAALHERKQAWCTLIAIQLQIYLLCPGRGSDRFGINQKGGSAFRKYRGKCVRDVMDCVENLREKELTIWLGVNRQYRGQY